MNKTRKILVTGGAGFIGSSLIDKLLMDGHEIICLDNFNDYYSPVIKRKNIQNLLSLRAFHLMEIDIRDTVSLEKAFHTYEVDTVIHLAAQPGVKFSFENPSYYFDVNINGTLHILDLCKKYKVKELIFGSSSSVYGVAKPIPFSERGGTKPISPYGISKKAGELLCFNYHYLYHLPITILRFFTVYGPRQRPDMALYAFTKSIDERKEISVYGDGSTKRDYTYISDITDGICLALGKKLDFQILNIGNSRPIPLSRVISLIEKWLGKKAQIRYFPERSGDPRITFADISTAEKLIGYHPKVRIEDGIKRFIAWYKNEKA